MDIYFVASGKKEERIKGNDVLFLLKNEIIDKFNNFQVNCNVINLSDKIEIEYPEENDEVLELNMIITNDNSEFKLYIKKASYEENIENIFIYISVVNELKKNDFNQEVYDFKIKVSKIASKYFKEIYWMKDSHNQLISSLLYPRMHYVENKFREIITHYMIKKYGVGWFRSIINNQYLGESEGYGGWYVNKYPELSYINYDLFNLLTRHLITMLKESYEEDVINKVLKEINTIKSIEKLDLKEIFVESVINSKDLWTKEFNEFFCDNMGKEWEEFSNMRNIVAHNKIITQRFYKDFLNKIDLLEKEFANAEIIINRRILSIEERMLNSYINNSYHEIYMNECDFEVYSDDKDVIEKIIEHDDWIIFKDAIEEEFDHLDGLLEDYSNILDDINSKMIDIYEDDDEAISEIEKSDLRLINELFNDKSENQYLLIDEFIKHVDNSSSMKIVLNSLNDALSKEITRINNMKEELFYEFEIEEDKVIIKLLGLNEIKYRVELSGWFSIDRGHSDHIYINLIKNAKEDICNGLIEISFGDYEETDYGAALPSYEDGIFINVSDLESEIAVIIDDIKNKVSERIEKLNSLSFV